MTVKKSVRFEVFKRDSFTCQYCGNSAPDVTLHIDHIEPRSKGGSDDITNLITSCVACNLGKSDKRLDDNTALIKRKRQLDDLQERREQLEMLMKWHKGLLDIEQDVIEKVCDFWAELCPGYTVNENGIKHLKSYVKKYGLNDVLEAMKISASQYLAFNVTNDGSLPVLDNDSVQKAFNYIPRICHNKKIQADKPYLKKLYYIRGILRNRLHYVNDWKSIKIMEDAFLSGVSLEQIQDVSKEVKNWTEFVKTIGNLANKVYN